MGDLPIAGAGVLALFPNKTWKQAPTYESRTAVLDLQPALLPIRVLVAAAGSAAHLERHRRPADGSGAEAIYVTTLDVRFDPASLGPKFHKSDCT